MGYRRFLCCTANGSGTTTTKTWPIACSPTNSATDWDCTGAGCGDVTIAVTANVTGRYGGGCRSTEVLALDCNWTFVQTSGCAYNTASSGPCFASCPEYDGGCSTATGTNFDAVCIGTNRPSKEYSVDTTERAGLTVTFDYDSWGGGATCPAEVLRKVTIAASGTKRVVVKYYLADGDVWSYTSPSMGNSIEQVEDCLDAATGLGLVATMSVDADTLYRGLVAAEQRISGATATINYLRPDAVRYYMNGQFDTDGATCGDCADLQVKFAPPFETRLLADQTWNEPCPEDKSWAVASSGDDVASITVAMS
jgi:hypothetical protein